MITINWRSAPLWANYAAMDKDGEWYWYQELPEADDEWGVFLSNEGTQHESFVDAGPDLTEADWQQTITKRQ